MGTHDGDPVTIRFRRLDRPLILLAIVLEQQTELQPMKIMTDTGAYSDVVFGLFRLLGYRFSPRLADIGGTRFWRIDANAGYGELNAIARQRVSLSRIEAHWDDFLRLAGSLKLGRGPGASYWHHAHLAGGGSADAIGFGFGVGVG